VGKKCKSLEILAIHFCETSYEENFIIAIEAPLNIDIFDYNHVWHLTALFRKTIYTLVPLKAVSESLNPSIILYLPSCSWFKKRSILLILT
jgi:hypothetical protein